MSKKAQRNQGKKKEEEAAGAEDENEKKGIEAQVTEVLGRTGSRGQVTQVKVKFQEQPSGKYRVLVRNVRGAVRKDDWLLLMESEREARRLR